MAWSSTYWPHGAEVRYTGVTTGAEILEAKGQFFVHRFTNGAQFILCDFTPVDRFDVATAEVELIVDQDRNAVADHPELAEVVIAPTPLQFGLARMWQIRVGSVRPRTAVVRSRSEALEWLENHGISVPSHTESHSLYAPPSKGLDSPPPS
jgi:hypothetical protein